MPESVELLFFIRAGHFVEVFMGRAEDHRRYGLLGFLFPDGGHIAFHHVASPKIGRSVGIPAAVLHDGGNGRPCRFARLQIGAEGLLPVFEDRDRVIAGAGLPEGRLPLSRPAYGDERTAAAVFQVPIGECVVGAAAVLGSDDTLGGAYRKIERA